MKFKKIFLPIPIVAFSIFIISCGNNSAKNNEVTESKQQESMETLNADSNSQNKVDTTTLNTTHLPAGIIALDKLPAGVKEFVEQNYLGYKIINAASDPLCQGGDAIDVAVTKNGSANLSLIFTPNGHFVQQEEDVPLSTAPGKISDSLKSKYSGYAADKQIERLILADRTVQYLVDLTKGKVAKEVIFSADGNIVCESK